MPPRTALSRAELAAGFQRENPRAVFDCNASRTIPAGGALAGLLLHPSVTPFQQIFRVNPVGGIFTASLSRPVVMTIGSFVVPRQMTLALAEYRFRPYRFDGLIPGDAVPLEDRRLSLEIGNTVPISANLQKGNISAQIIPGKLPNPTDTTFANINAGTASDAAPLFGELATFEGLPPNIYSTAEARDARNVAPPVAYIPPVNPKQFVLSAQGDSLIPNSNDPTQGAERLPFTYYVPENTPVSLQVTVFAPIRIPIAFFEGVIMGVLADARALSAFLEQVRPCQGQGQ